MKTFLSTLFFTLSFYVQSQSSFNIDDVNGQTLTLVDYADYSIRIFDSGGENGNYGNNEDYEVTICDDYCFNENQIQIIYNQFNFDIEEALESQFPCFDWLEVITNTSSNQYCNFSNPPNVEFSSGCVTLKFHSDEFITRSGFDISFTLQGRLPISSGDILCEESKEGSLERSLGSISNSSVNEYNCTSVLYDQLYSNEDVYTLGDILVDEIDIILQSSSDIKFFLAQNLFSQPGCESYDIVACGDNNNPILSFDISQYNNLFIIVDSEWGGNYSLYLSCNNPQEECSEGAFDDYSQGPITTKSNIDPWVKWSSTSGDGTVTTERSFEGDNSLKITSSNPTTNIVYQLGNITGNDVGIYDSDVYRYSWKMFVPQLNGAYYNMQHSESLNNLAYQVMFNVNGTAELKYGVGNNVKANFIYPKNVWFSVTQIIRLKTDEIELWIDGKFVIKWQFSIGTNTNGVSNLKQIGALNFFGDSNLNSTFYIDNFLCDSYERCGGISDPSFFPEKVCVNKENYSGLDAYCRGYTEEEWTEGECTTGPCSDCWDCFYYVGDDNDPLICKFNNSYCGPNRNLNRSEILSSNLLLDSYSYEWSVQGVNGKFSKWYIVFFF